MSYEQSPEIGALAKALAEAQAKMGPAAFDSKNPHFGSRFASLASVREAAKPLAEAGISISQWPLTRDDGSVGVRTQLTHASGQWCASTVWAKPERPGPQALGSILTYLRRYSLSACCGIAADEDEDANGADSRRLLAQPTGTRGAAPSAAPAPASAPKAAPKASPAALKTLVAALQSRIPGEAKDPAVQALWVTAVARVLDRSSDDLKLRNLSDEDVARAVAGLAVES